MYECFNCCTKSVIWDNDFTFADYGIEGDEIVHVCHCTNCGAEIYYFIRIDEENEGGQRDDRSNT